MWRAARRRRPDVVSARLLGSATVDAFAANVRPVIEQIQASGVGSPRDVAKALTAHGVRTARGGSVWAAVQVSTLGRRCARAADRSGHFGQVVMTPRARAPRAHRIQPRSGFLGFRCCAKLAAALSIAQHQVDGYGYKISGPVGAWTGRGVYLLYNPLKIYLVKKLRGRARLIGIA